MIYTIEYNIGEICLDVEIEHSHCEGNRWTPPYTHTDIVSIEWNGRKVSLEEVAHLMSLDEGDEITPFTTEEDIIKTWENEL